MDEIETQNHPDAVSFPHGISCRELREVLKQRDALRSRLGMLMPADANFDWEEWPGGWPDILSAYEAQRDAAAALRVEAETLRAKVPQAIQDVMAERRRQDGKWGGPEHDDTLSPLDWHETISDYNGWARRMLCMGSLAEGRRRLIQVAALALAEVEALDRSASAPQEVDRG